MPKTDISIIVCTYNKPEFIRKCLNSILRQKIDKKIEILLVDGGSDEATIKVIKEFERKNKKIKLIHNPEKLPEGYGKGKWLGFKKAKGEIVGIIDQDNELIGENCLKDLVEPFKDKEIFGVACRLYMKKNDNLTNQCIALIGTDGFLAYRSLDGIINKNLKLEDAGKYSVLTLKEDNLIATGGNCFFYRKKPLDEIGGYIQDTDNLLELIRKGYNKIAIPKNAFTHHKAVKGFWEFVRKKKKWGREYSPKTMKFSWWPKTRLERRKFIKNAANIALVFPIILDAVIMAFKTKQKQWLFVPVLKIVTTFAYITQKRYL